MKVEELVESSILEAFDRHAYYKSFNGRIKKMYEKAVVRTRNKEYKDGIIDPDEFFEFAANSEEYKEIFKQWEENDYDIRFTPTLDRKDATKGYVKGNLQFLSYHDNVIKGNLEYDKRPYEARKRKVVIEKDGKTKEFGSMTDLATFLSKSPATISRATANGLAVDGWSIKFV